MVMESKRPTRPLSERFWPKVQRAGPAECWGWTGATNGVGYGKLQSGRRGEPALYAHRVAYKLAYGDVPDGLFVLHRCDNPSCVNPQHLFLGTNLDNVRDMTRKGRQRHVGSKGEHNGNAKLTLPQVIEIRTEYRVAPKSKCGYVAQGTLKRLAARYGVTAANICSIGRGMTWT